MEYLSYRPNAGVPSNFSFHRTDDGVTHVFFIGAQETSVQDLYFASIPAAAVADSNPLAAVQELPWRKLVALPGDYDPVCFSFSADIFMHVP